MDISRSLNPLAVLPTFLVAFAVIGCSKPQPTGAGSNDPAASTGQAPAASVENAPPRPMQILEPLDKALFPPDIAAPTFRWLDENPAARAWLVQFRFPQGEPLDFRADSQAWTPPDEAWETIKRRSREEEVEIVVRGVDPRQPANAISQAAVRISTSQDAVEAPLFYQEMRLPFRAAVKDPAASIRWRFGPVSSTEPPPIVLERLPVCGNCHSFSNEGSTLALGVDPGNDRGSHAIAPIKPQIVLDESKLITWSGDRKDDGETTFGLFCQVSPDGRYVVGTVKDRALAVATSDPMFSQLFFPVKGILAIYDRQTKTHQALPGADDPRFVQTNPTWSPDGKSLVFARAEAYEPEGLQDVQSVLVPPQAARDFLEGGKTFRYDLYRIPFNDGQGGTAEPVESASNNGMSNYFAKFSPDGRWIVFCKARSFMLLQPDSQLMIIPAAGGEARRLECNTPRMNSWHSWSPNGKWLVFSSKAYSAYTQLFLTHIDAAGHSSVPVVLSRFGVPERAAGVPEFVNVAPHAIRKITEAFLDDHHYYRAALEFIRQDDTTGAVPLLQKAIEINPAGSAPRLQMAAILAGDGNVAEAKSHLVRVLRLHPDHAEAHGRLAVILYTERKLDEAVEHCRQAIQGDPDSSEARSTLGMILLERGELDEAVMQLAEAARLAPDVAATSYYCGHALYRQGKVAQAVPYYQRTLELDPQFVPALLDLASVRMMPDPEIADLGQALTLAAKACEVTHRRDPLALKTLAGVHALRGQFGDAAATAREAFELARASGDPYLSASTEKMLKIYEELQARKPK
jgi:tetratricopeptide (TPR) repeat protein